MHTTPLQTPKNTSSTAQSDPSTCANMDRQREKRRSSLFCTGFCKNTRIRTRFADGIRKPLKAFYPKEKRLSNDRHVDKGATSC